MALFLPGPMIADARGSIGGTCFSRAASGNYARNRTKPVNPRSPGQETARSTLTIAADAWNRTLTQAQRNDWKAYAEGTTWTNKLGQSIQIPAISAFARLYALRLLIGQTAPAAAPTEMGHAGNPAFTFTAEPTNAVIKVTEPGAPFVKTTVGHLMTFWMTLPASAGRLTTPSGKVYLGALAGAAVPPEFPKSFVTKYTMAVGQRITVFGQFIDDHNRIGSQVKMTALAANP